MNIQNRLILTLTGLAGALVTGVLVGMPSVTAQIGGTEQSPGTTTQQQPGTTQQQPGTTQQQPGATQQQPGTTQQQQDDQADEGVRALW